ncbi:hypothetical protein LGQ02_14175 [Bacillus shivajii]|uniref:hypothetical protein n=1 Tax=Bacillus shivajii TaxID=1983719 RepID=UPI001CFBEF5C|nr:hypothetical protein [Bacillus shivajii]UCZ51992.1 hypothetical protein LGQ02_14175 [Bacillus shivajii]
MKLHRPFAIVSFILVVSHLYFALSIRAEWNSSYISGMLTTIAFIVLLTSGWIRHKKATGKRRRSHQYTAISFIILLIIHIIM